MNDVEKNDKTNSSNVTIDNALQCSPKVKEILDYNHDFTLLSLLAMRLTDRLPTLQPHDESTPTKLQLPQSPCESLTNTSNIYRPKAVKKIPLKILENSILDFQSKIDEANDVKMSLHSAFEQVSLDKEAEMII